MAGLGKLNLFLCGAVSLHVFEKLRKENHFKCSNNFQKYASCEEKSSLCLAMVYFRDGRRTPILKKIEVMEVEWPLEWVNKELPHTMFDYEIKNARPFPSWIKASLLDQLHSNYGKFKGGAGHGMLTKFGQEDSFKLGQILRKRYIDKEKLISSNYSNDHLQFFYNIDITRILVDMMV
ncbi:hypothetical protein MXB_1662 [Myxobolus squamalis]|nr:hypothetical protein MXB_1662 [Myxobolus squamalis]